MKRIDRLPIFTRIADMLKRYSHTNAFHWLLILSFSLVWFQWDSKATEAGLSDLQESVVLEGTANEDLDSNDGQVKNNSEGINPYGHDSDETGQESDLFQQLSSVYMNAQSFPDHLFQKHSTWYEKIPDPPEILSRGTCTSENYIQDVLSNSGILTISYRDWSVPIWVADEDTPEQWVDVPYPEGNQPEEWYWVPIPSQAQSASAGDSHMVIVSHDWSYAWDFWHAEKHSDGHWSSGTFRCWDLSGDGINSPYDMNGSARVAPVPLLHGLITYDEVVNKGYINHALAFSYSQAQRNSPGVYPCETPNNGYCDRECCLWLGFRLQLDPDLDLDTLNLNWASKIIARAMQEYGMIFVENNGVGYNSVYAESLDAKEESWSGIFDGTIVNIPIDRFRIVEPVYPTEVTTPEDINQDGNVDAYDLQLCVNVYTGHETDPGLVARADVDENGIVNQADIQQVVNAILIGV
jgi:hypothetical protein